MSLPCYLKKNYPNGIHIESIGAIQGPENRRENNSKWSERQFGRFRRQYINFGWRVQRIQE